VTARTAGKARPPPSESIDKNNGRRESRRRLIDECSWLCALKDPGGGCEVEMATRAPFDRFAAVVASSDDAIVTKTPDGTITSWNRAATRLFGYDPDDAIGRSITMLFPRKRFAEEAELMARIARG